MKFFYLLSVLIISISLSSQEKSNAFRIIAKGDHYKVIGPLKTIDATSVIIENKMINKLVGRIVDDKNNVVMPIAIKANSFKSVDVNFISSKKYFFVPLSPAFQSIELKPGNKAYEIPSKR